MSLRIFLLICSMLFLGLAAFRAQEPAWLSYGWLGLALWMLTNVLGDLKV